MIFLADEGTTGLRRRLEVQEREDWARFCGQTLARSPRSSSWQRRRDASVRVLIDLEEHLPLILEEIRQKYKTPGGIRNIQAHASTRDNVLQEVADRLAVAYEVPPVRDFGTTAAVAMKFRRSIVGEAQFDLQAEQWARYAFISNVVHVLPHVTAEGKLRYETVLPHAAEVLIDDGDHEPSVLIYDVQGAGFCRVAVDAERYWFLSESWEVVREVEHGYLDLDGSPLRPWVPWRVRPWLSGTDYWQRKVGQKLVDTTLYVARVQAHMDYVRQINNGKYTTLTTGGRIADDASPEQRLTPEKPGVFSGDAKLEVHDLVVPVTEFVAQIDRAWNTLARSYGVTTGSFGVGDGGPTDPDAQAAVKKLRRMHTKHLRVADARTHVVSAIVMQADGHPEAIDPQAIAGTRTTFGPLTYVDKPIDALATAEKEIALGQLDQVRLYQRNNPELTLEQARADVQERIEERAAINEFQAARNMPADAAQDNEGLAQAQGRVGGQAIPDSPDGEGDENEDERRTA